MYVSKNVRIRCHFSKPEGVHEKKSFGNTGLRNMLRFSRIYQSYYLPRSWYCLCIWLRCRYSYLYAAVYLLILATGKRVVNVMPITLQTSLRRTFHFRVQGKKMFFDPEGRGSIFSVGIHVPEYTSAHPRRLVHL
jgi:hypothetical protein